MECRQPFRGVAYPTNIYQPNADSGDEIQGFFSLITVVVVTLSHSGLTSADTTADNKDFDDGAGETSDDDDDND